MNKCTPLLLSFCISFIFAGATTASTSSEVNEDMASSVKRVFSNGCKIEILPGGKYVIEEGSERLECSDEGKPIFPSDTGEKVIEYSGLAVDGNKDRSWAQAFFEPGCTSPAHSHTKLTEDYYITSAGAKLRLL